jgi:hypothetical protein
MMVVLFFPLTADSPRATNIDDDDDDTFFPAVVEAEKSLELCDDQCGLFVRATRSSLVHIFHSSQAITYSPQGC